MDNLTLSQHTVDNPVEQTFTVPVSKIFTKSYEVTATSKRVAHQKAVELAMQDDWSKEEPEYETYDFIM